MDELPEDNFAQGNLMFRLGRIADIIFAFAMAQCFFYLDFPQDFNHPRDSETIEFLLSQLKPLASYTIGFIIIGYYWLDHIKQFRYFKKVDDLHISIYLLYLMSMFLIPYTNTLVIYFPENAIVKICLSANTAFIGLVSFLNWTYATHHHRLVAADLDDLTIESTKRRILIEPVFSLMTIVLATIDQTLWDYIWLLLPIPYIAIEKIYMKDKNISNNTVSNSTLEVSTNRSNSSD
jgi:uncharacterized membrane protein